MLITVLEATRGRVAIAMAATREGNPVNMSEVSKSLECSEKTGHF
jgi:hypothetical protein